MTPNDLSILFRSDVQDSVEPFLWTDDDVCRYMDDAQIEFARRTDYFFDRTTFASVSIVAATATYSPTNYNKILRVVRAKLTSQSRPLLLRTVEQVDREGVLGNDYGTKNAFNWETTSGPPAVLITNWDRNTFRLTPNPSSNDTLSLHVYRRPLNTLTGASTTLEIDEVEHQRALLSWMKYLAYLKQDADVYNEDLSDKFLNDFIEYTTKVKRDLRRLHRVSGTTRYGGL